MSRDKARDTTIARFRFEDGSGRRVVVYGPPCSGKTTMVERDKRPGDMVWDLDAIASAMLDCPDHQCPTWALPALQSMRGAMIRSIVDTSPPTGVWVIVTDGHEAARIARLLRAELIAMDTDQATCVRRAVEAGRKKAARDAISRWFERN